MMNNPPAYVRGLRIAKTVDEVTILARKIRQLIETTPDASLLALGDAASELCRAAQRAAEEATYDLDPESDDSWHLRTHAKLTLVGCAAEAEAEKLESAVEEGNPA